MAGRSNGFFSANSSPSTTNPTQFYTDFILYPKKPLYFEYVQPANVAALPSCGTGANDAQTCIPFVAGGRPDGQEGSSGWKMFPNPCAGAVYVITIVQVPSEEDYQAIVYKVIQPGLIKPEAILGGQAATLRQSMKISLKTSSALGRWIWQFCVGFYICVVSRIGCVSLRAPRWSADYSNYCFYQAGMELGVDNTKDQWIAPNKCCVAGMTQSFGGGGTLGFTDAPTHTMCDIVGCGGAAAPCACCQSSGTCCPCVFQPFVPMPIELTERTEKIFRLIAETACNLNAASSSYVAGTDTVSVNTGAGNSVAVLDSLRICVPNAPWLSNPPVWAA